MLRFFIKILKAAVNSQRTKKILHSKNVKNTNITMVHHPTNENSSGYIEKHPLVHPVKGYEKETDTNIQLIKKFLKNVI